MNDLVLYMIELLTKLKEEFDADCVKVYFEKDNNYCVKVIKGGKNIKTFRKKDGEKYFDRKGEKHEVR